MEESTRKLISHLYSRNITPDDLIQEGIPLDVVVRFSRELNYQLPPHLNNITIPGYPLTSLEATISPQSTATVIATQPLSNFTPSQSNTTNTNVKKQKSQPQPQPQPQPPPPPPPLPQQQQPPLPPPPPPPSSSSQRIPSSTYHHHHHHHHHTGHHQSNSSSYPTKNPFVPNHETSMIIDLSDESDVENPQTNISKSEIENDKLAKLEAKRKLEEKEREIKLMNELIATKLESINKKKNIPSSSPSTPTNNNNNNTHNNNNDVESCRKLSEINNQKNDIISKKTELQKKQTDLETQILKIKEELSALQENEEKLTMDEETCQTKEKEININDNNNNSSSSSSNSSSSSSSNSNKITLVKNINKLVNDNGKRTVSSESTGSSQQQDPLVKRPKLSINQSEVDQLGKRFDELRDQNKKILENISNLNKQRNDGKISTKGAAATTTTGSENTNSNSLNNNNNIKSSSSLLSLSSPITKKEGNIRTSNYSAEISNQDDSAAKVSSENNSFEQLTPYVSPLMMFKSFRFHPNYKELVGDYKSMTYSNSLNVQHKVCLWESHKRGRCNDFECMSQHWRQFKMNDEQVIQDMASYVEGRNPGEKEFYRAGMIKLLEDLKENGVTDLEETVEAIRKYRNDFCNNHRIDDLPGQHYISFNKKIPLNRNKEAEQHMPASPRSDTNYDYVSESETSIILPSSPNPEFTDGNIDPDTNMHYQPSTDDDDGGFEADSEVSDNGNDDNKDHTEPIEPITPDEPSMEISEEPIEQQTTEPQRGNYSGLGVIGRLYSWFR